ncbi:MAG: ribonuclease E/G [Pseudomonadota bacterium]
MKGRIIVLGQSPTGAPAAALLVDGVLEDYLENGQDRTPELGEIYVAKVARAGGKGAGCFVSLDTGQQGFLRDGGGLKEGRTTLVQVAGYAEPGKAPPVTRRLLLKGHLLIHTPGAPGLNVSRQIKDTDERDRLENILKAAAEPYFAAAEGGVPAPDQDATPAEKRHRTMAMNGAFLEQGGMIIRSAAHGVSDAELTDEFEGLLAQRRNLHALLHREHTTSPVGGAILATDRALLEWATPAPDAIVLSRDWQKTYGRPALGAGDPAGSGLPGRLHRLLRPEDGDPLDRLGVWDTLETLRAPSTELPSGGGMVIEPTTALVAVDVNTGGDFSPAAGLKANIEAARALPRQLRLRGLGGQILVDFAPMPKKDRRTVESALKAALKRDAIETTAHGFTTMGLFELQRRRERRPLHELR